MLHRSTVLFFLFSFGCVDNEVVLDPFGTPTPPAETGEEMAEAGEVVCSNPVDLDFFTLEVSCAAPYLEICEVGKFDQYGNYQSTACCASEDAGAVCIMVAPTFCNGTPQECPGGVLVRGECPEGTISTCDYE